MTNTQDTADISRHRPESPLWELRLYVAGQTARSVRAFANLKQICEEYLAGQYTIEVIDLMENPHLGKQDQIVAIPTLIRKLPEPVRKIIGDLANKERVLVGLEIHAVDRGPPGRDQLGGGGWRASAGAPSVARLVPGQATIDFGRPDGLDRTEMATGGGTAAERGKVPTSL